MTGTVGTQRRRSLPGQRARGFLYNFGVSVDSRALKDAGVWDFGGSLHLRLGDFVADLAHAHIVDKCDARMRLPAPSKNSSMVAFSRSPSSTK